MGHVSKEEIARARELDLLTYLQEFDPTELVYVGGNTYCTRTHDSLKISNGKWYWWSHGFGGVSALDYLVWVEDRTLPEAVSIINRTPLAERHNDTPRMKVATELPKPFQLPSRHTDNRRVYAYLCSRGIDPDLISSCIKQGLLYEEHEHHNAVFVGLDGGGVPRYATMRSTSTASTFLLDVEGSDKRHCFSLKGGGSAVFVFEGAIDALSHATLDKLAGRDWRSRTYLSLGGVTRQKKHGPPKLPRALAQYLSDHPETENVVLCLDADAAGRRAAGEIAPLIQGAQVWDRPPKRGKDYNELLQLKLGLHLGIKMRGRDSTIAR